MNQSTITNMNQNTNCVHMSEMYEVKNLGLRLTSVTSLHFQRIDQAN